jgi:hypothetical protein
MKIMMNVQFFVKHYNLKTCNHKLILLKSIQTHTKLQAFKHPRRVPHKLIWDDTLRTFNKTGFHRARFLHMYGPLYSNRNFFQVSLVISTKTKGVNGTTAGTQKAVLFISLTAHLLLGSLTRKS